MTEQVGFLGVGKIGSPMARRLLGHGHRVRVFDVVPAAREPFRAIPGATVCSSVIEVVERAGTIFLSLPSPAALEQVTLGPDGRGLGEVHVVVDLSTSGVRAARAVAAQLQARGVRYLDAPVSGGVRGAEVGTLSIMAAGDKAVFESVRPLLSILGKNVFYIGAEPGLGQAMKLVNNMLSATTLVATAEAMVVAVKAGLDPALALDVLNASSGRSGATQDKFPRAVLTRTFDYGFTVEHMLKDVSLFGELAAGLQVPTFICREVIEMWRLAASRGLGPEDFTHLVGILEEWAAVKIGGSS